MNEDRGRNEVSSIENERWWFLSLVSVSVLNLVPDGEVDNLGFIIFSFG